MKILLSLILLGASLSAFSQSSKKTYVYKIHRPGVCEDGVKVASGLYNCIQRLSYDEATGKGEMMLTDYPFRITVSKESLLYDFLIVEVGSGVELGIGQIVTQMTFEILDDGYSLREINTDKYWDLREDQN